MIFKKALSLAMATAMIGGIASVAVSAKEYKMQDLVVDSGSSVVIDDIDEFAIGDTVVSDKTLYVQIPSAFGNSDLFKFSAKKGDNAKMIKKISLVEKDIDSRLAGREWCVKIEINEDMTDTEYKMNPSYSFTCKKDIDERILQDVVLKSGDKFTQTIRFWIKNGEVGGTDQSYEAGRSGVYAKPAKNDNNEVIWSDLNRDLAKLSYIGDSEVKVYYPKLSTKWKDDVYAAHFANSEAFKFEFVGNPTISATARPTLTIYNPFKSDDGEYTVDASELTVYQLIDDAFVDVTDKFTAGTDDDGNQVLTTKTRTLGYYVVCHEVAAASGENTPGKAG